MGQDGRGHLERDRPRGGEGLRRPGPGGEGGRVCVAGPEADAGGRAQHEEGGGEEHHRPT